MQSNDDIVDGGYKGTDMRFEEDLYDTEKGEDDDDEYGKGGEDYENENVDIYIMMQFCLSVTKNDHFLLGVSCNHLNPC